MENTKELTKEQKIFKVGLRKLKRFDSIRESGLVLTAEQAFEEEKIKEVLFSEVRDFGFDLFSKMTQKYKLPSDCYADIHQELAMIFFEKYKNYNPDLATPTTYFVRYFKQVISNYLCKNIHHLSSYDAMNVLKVRKAIAFYEGQGINWTEEMLTTKTGLSAKVVHSTLMFSYSSNYAPIDELFDLKSIGKTPEESFTEKESMENLYKAICDNATEDEIELLTLRINPEGSKELSYEKIAKIKGISVRDVKRVLNRCICKINQDKKFVKKYNQKTYSKYKNSLKLQMNASSMFDDCVL